MVLFWDLLLVASIMVGDAQLHMVCIEILKKKQKLLFLIPFVVVCTLTAMLWF